MMNHLSQIAQALPEHDLDAILITSEAGERYALGFHGEGVVLVTRKGAHYSTDGRYMEQAQAQVTGAKITCFITFPPSSRLDTFPSWFWRPPPGCRRFRR